MPTPKTTCSPPALPSNFLKATPTTSSTKVQDNVTVKSIYYVKNLPTYLPCLFVFVSEQQHHNMGSANRSPLEPMNSCVITLSGGVHLPPRSSNLYLPLPSYRHQKTVYYHARFPPTLPQLVKKHIIILPIHSYTIDSQANCSTTKANRSKRHPYATTAGIPTHLLIHGVFRLPHPMLLPVSVLPNCRHWSRMETLEWNQGSTKRLTREKKIWLTVTLFPCGCFFCFFPYCSFRTLRFVSCFRLCTHSRHTVFSRRKGG